MFKVDIIYLKLTVFPYFKMIKQSMYLFKNKIALKNMYLNMLDLF